jgi:hypothetical protein
MKIISPNQTVDDGDLTTNVVLSPGDVLRMPLKRGLMDATGEFVDFTADDIRYITMAARESANESIRAAAVYVKED